MRTMMLLAGMAAALAGSPFAAQAADPWGLANEKVATFRAKVVDALCGVTGDCPKDCGAGRRQMALLTQDGTLRLAVKGAFDFAGPVTDLMPYCGREIEVDGLLIEDPRIPMMFVQQVRVNAGDPWIPADSFGREWSAKHGDNQDWVRKDPTVREIIAKDGVFGIPGLRSKSPNVSNPQLRAEP